MFVVERTATRDEATTLKQFGTLSRCAKRAFYQAKDAYQRALERVYEQRIPPPIKKNPFASIDQTGVGQLMQIAVTKGRATRPDIKLGICGEHGGDPDSVKFCHRIGLNYVSCSPFRVPVARLAAAQAALEDNALANKANGQMKYTRGARKATKSRRHLQYV